MTPQKLALEEVKKLQMEILSEVDKFCKENKLCYSLSFGTLIGAIRHKGYIPWDDDIDIMMPRPDYDKFINNFDGYHPDLKLLNSYNDDCYYKSFSKVYNNRTKFVAYNYRGGVFIDIFPIDGLPSKESIDQFIKEKREVEIGLWRSSKIYKCADNKTKAFLTYCIKKIIFPSRKTAIKRLNNFAQKWSFTKYSLATSSWHGRNYLPKKDFYDTIPMDFENYRFMCIKEYDKFLKLIYGDYMTLPPEDEQHPHHKIVYYWK